ncbi:hypothetical protein [Crateriforma conspicua]|nr:hypothetical protein [Crateriforma conspicua]
MLSRTSEYALRALTCLAERSACSQTPSPDEEVAHITQVLRRYGR